MTSGKQTVAASEFAERWRGKGYEKGESQKFWMDLLEHVFGVENIAEFIVFEKQIKLAHTGFIDGYIPSTHVLIEQKSLGKNLREKIKQSDGTLLSPFEQAKRYAAELPYSRRPRWVVTCNFEEFLIYDMENPADEPQSVLLENLPKECHRLGFLVNTDDDNIRKETEVSIKAGEIVGRLYDEILKQYIDPANPETLKSLNKLCVRLVFCLYAEDAEIFGRHGQFFDYINSFPARDMRGALINLFKILDTPDDKRDPYIDERLAAFPYVNGGLFADENIEIPRFSEEIRSLLLQNASADFDWSEISPTIFGAVFESTLNPETRRKGGMHYTSIENIHKVIDPLFLDDLNAEFDEITKTKYIKTLNDKLEKFQAKLASLTFLDPACGSGNFLTETYLCLRRLENKVISLLRQGNLAWFDNPIRVSIGQFYGIEINDFAVTVAKTALWIAESQMLKQTEQIVKQDLNFLPLKSYANIIEGNALRLDWQTVVPAEKLDYIMGNPPFVGARIMSKEQKGDLLSVFGKGWKNAGNLDYVSCWYKKAVDLINGTQIRCALVSTNSVSQGESVAILWKPLFEMGVHIDYAHRTFRWDSEAKIKAHVHCVIIGFSTAPSRKPKVIYSAGDSKIAQNINGYLIDADNVFIERRTKPIVTVPEINLGGQPIDDGNLVLTKTEKDDLLKQEPNIEPYIRYYMMGKDFINRSPRYCLWLKEASPALLKKCPLVLQRIKNVKEFRLKSNRTSTLRAAQTPSLFGALFECKTDYIAIPKVSSENRKYIPMDYLDKDIIPGDKLFVMQNATLYHFGILTSNVHMAWMRAVCGRLKSDYSYSNTIVYNNFPWCSPDEKQRLKIEQTAQEILDARALYPDCSLADLYDENTMPPELRRAHSQNDRAVMRAYGFNPNLPEPAIVAELMKMYKNLTCEM